MEGVATPMRMKCANNNDQKNPEKHPSSSRMLTHILRRTSTCTNELPANASDRIWLLVSCRCSRAPSPRCSATNAWRETAVASSRSEGNMDGTAVTGSIINIRANAPGSFTRRNGRNPSHTISTVHLLLSNVSNKMDNTADRQKSYSSSDEVVGGFDTSTPTSIP